MRPKVAAVVPPSPHNQRVCWKCRRNSIDLPFCSQCGALQDCPENLTHFETLGFPVSLNIDEEKLRESFYRLCQKLHPDRFATVAPPESLYSLRWTTVVNRAFQTLKNQEARSYYILGLYQMCPVQEKNAIPLELAETYFELQDAIGNEEGQQKLSNLRELLKEKVLQTEKEWQEIADRWEKSDSREELLKRLNKNLIQKRYLHSMIADLERTLGEACGDRRH